jgi:mutator protein MutT
VIRVVAALIQENGRLLICQRRRDDSFPLKWEFPGGKVRPGETPAVALERELREELGVRCTVGMEVYRVFHRYAEHAEEIELKFFAVELSGARPRNLAFEQFEWAEASRLPEYDFLPADRELIGQLASGALALP